MAGTTISFNCPHCQKKFTAPAAAAGKTVSCGCGARIAVPSANSPGVAAQTAPASSPTPATTPSFVPTAAAATTSAFAFQSPPQGAVTAPSLASGGRREFPALKTVARILVILSWIYIVGGALVGLLLLGAGAQNGPNGLGPALAILLGLAVAILLAVIFIRATAELIRLALYVAELLEDIRAK